MKKFYRVQRSAYIFTLTLILSLFSPVHSFAAPAGEEDVVIFVSCVEDLGNGMLLAHFGYENPNPETVTVQDKKSYIAYNYTRDEKYVISSFAPGVHDKVFQSGIC